MSKPFKPPPPGSDPLLRELQEEIRRERYQKLWEQYGVYALAVAALVVAAVGAYQFWEHRRVTAAQEAGAAYQEGVEAIEAGKTDDGLKSLERLAQKGPRGYSALARLQVAGAYVKAGRMAEAVGVYQSLASDSRADTLLRDYARLQAASARSGEADWTEMQNRLSDLLTDGNPWRMPARELWGFAALKAGKTAEARDAFSQIAADGRASADMRERANMALSTLVSAAPPAAATPPSTAPAAAAPPAAAEAPAPPSPETAPKQD